MRLFVAVELPSPVKDELARVADVLKPALPEARWVPRENLHLTVKFVGHVGEDRVRAISAAVGEVAAGLVDFSTHLQDVGAFPSARRARVLWVGLADPAGGLAGIATALDEALEPLGVRREARGFTAHLTLARLRTPAGVTHLPEVAPDPMPFPVDRLTLFQSRLSRPAPRYEALATFPFLAGSRRRSP